METRESQGRGRMPVYFTFLFSSEDIPIGHLEGVCYNLCFYNRLCFPQGHQKTQETKSSDWFDKTGVGRVLRCSFRFSTVL
jgi:hypothetical protein